MRILRKLSLCMALLYQEHGVPIKYISKKYSKYRTSSVYRYCKQSLTDATVYKRKHNRKDHQY